MFVSTVTRKDEPEVNGAKCGLFRRGTPHCVLFAPLAGRPGAFLRSRMRHAVARTICPSPLIHRADINRGHRVSVRNPSQHFPAPPAPRAPPRTDHPQARTSVGLRRHAPDDATPGLHAGSDASSTPRRYSFPPNQRGDDIGRPQAQNLASPGYASPALAAKHSVETFPAAAV